MRILFLTNFYPPHELGGQGRSCRQVVEGLTRRGHTTQVLTSMHRIRNGPRRTENVHRALHLEMEMAPFQHALRFFTQRRRREQFNLRELAERVADFRPDVIFIWGMWNLNRSLPALAEALLPDRVAYRFAEYWPTLPSQHVLYWRTSGRRSLARLPKRLLGWIALRSLSREPAAAALNFRHAICVSAATRQELVKAGVPVAHAEIIHTGLDPSPFSGLTDRPARRERSRLRLLYAGRLTPDKGIETAIEAVRILRSSRRNLDLHLDIAGSGSDSYPEVLARKIRQLELERHISLLGRVPEERMPEIYHERDILLVPSIWPEPFARVVLEGMISGMVVIASRAGGTPEAIQDGVTGLLFTPGNANELAEQLARVGQDPDLRNSISTAARQTVLTRFDLEPMLERMEQFLVSIAENHPAPERTQGESSTGAARR